MSELQTRVVPCIDVMGGKVVQLVQGERKSLELDSPDQAIVMFEGFPLLHVIDLDAAMGRGDNRELIRYLLERVRARVGGGVRSIEDAAALIALGASQVIVGTAAFTGGGVDGPFLQRLADTVGRDRVIVAIDVKGGRVAVKGWLDTLGFAPEDVLAELEPYCAGFLCTYVDREGMMQGTDLDLFLRLRDLTTRTLIAAGGITTMQEVRTLLEAGIEVALGMAVYTGRLSLDELRSLSR
jgi:phosphoribosylformimino-5-aminoimidazole carboxamide ribotide isomerase